MHVKSQEDEHQQHPALKFGCFQRLGSHPAISFANLTHLGTLAKLVLPIKSLPCLVCFSEQRSQEELQIISRAISLKKAFYWRYMGFPQPNFRSGAAKEETVNFAPIDA